jgi:hypothetical protein
MSDYELELWDGMLRCAVASAGSANTRSTTVIEYTVERLGVNKVKWYATSCWTFARMLTLGFLFKVVITQSGTFALLSCRSWGQ